MASGLTTVLEEATRREASERARRDRVAAEHAQANLFEDEIEAAEQEAQAVVASDGTRGPGRPKGARNRSTEQLRKLVVAESGCPLRRVARWASMTPGEIMEEFGISTRADAVQLLVRFNETVLPYTAQKQPQAVELPPGSVAVFNFQIGEAAGEGDAPGDAFAFERAPGDAARVIEHDDENATNSDT